MLWYVLCNARHGHRLTSMSAHSASLALNRSRPAYLRRYTWVSVFISEWLLEKRPSTATHNSTRHPPLHPSQQHAPPLRPTTTTSPLYPHRPATLTTTSPLHPLHPATQPHHPLIPHLPSTPQRQQPPSSDPSPPRRLVHRPVPVHDADDGQVQALADLPVIRIVAGGDLQSACPELQAMSDGGGVSDGRGREWSSEHPS